MLVELGSDQVLPLLLLFFPLLLLFPFVILLIFLQFLPTRPRAITRSTVATTRWA